ncbi:Protein adenylyltransferase and cysteine protease IbpA [Dirofilaria immitis]
MLRERNRVTSRTARSLQCCFACAQGMSLRSRSVRRKNERKPEASNVLRVFNTSAIKNAKIMSGRIEIQKNEDHRQTTEKEHEEKQEDIFDHFQDDKARRHKLMQLDSLFREKNYFRKLDFRRVEQCAAWLDSERYHWGGWHIRIPTWRPRFGIVLAIGHCWWRKTSYKCAHKLVILVFRTSFSIIYEKHCHNHVISQKPLVSLKDCNNENNEPVEFSRTHLPSVETLLSH